MSQLWLLFAPKVLCSFWAECTQSDEPSQLASNYAQYMCMQFGVLFLLRRVHTNNFGKLFENIAQNLSIILLNIFRYSAYSMCMYMYMYGLCVICKAF